MPLASQPVSFGLLTQRSLSDEIVEVLQREMLTGIYQPGERLIERQIASQFGVSSIPVREALQELEARGLVVRRHNYGCLVIRLTEDDIAQLVQLRQLVEPTVMEWAAERMTREIASRLQKQIDAMKAAAAAKDISTFFFEDLTFHRMVWDASGNKYAAKALEKAMTPLFATGLMLARHPSMPDLKKEAEKHARLLEHLKHNRGAKAAEELRLIAEGFEKRLSELTAS